MTGRVSVRSIDQRRSEGGYQAVEEEVVIVRHRGIVEECRGFGAFVVLLQQCSCCFLGIFGVWDDVLGPFIPALASILPCVMRLSFSRMNVWY